MSDIAIFVPDKLTDLSDFAAPYAPPPSVNNHAARNAIPNSVRVEGMVCYTKSDQVLWQLTPLPWNGTDSDWVVFGTLQPFVPPTFTRFEISGQGSLVITGASISGSVTFTWADSVPANVLVNSIVIKDTSANVVLASGLADTGSHTLTLPSAVQLNAPGTHVWTVSGTDTKGNGFSLDFTVTWVNASSQTYYVRPDGSDSNNGKADNAGGAWLTLQHAADSVLVGDTVHVRAGTYVGFVLGWNAPQNGASGHPIAFLADPGVIVNHRNVHTADAIDVESCSYITLDGFTITNDGSVTRAGLRMSGAANGAICTNNSVSGCGRFGIFGGFQSNSLVQGNVVHDILASGGNTTGHGIYWSNALVSATIRLNTIYNCGGNGIHLNGDISQGGTGVADGCLIERNTLYNNQQTYLGGEINPDGLVNSVIQNNLIYACPGNGITLYQADAATGSTNNLVCNNTVLVSSATKWALNINTNSINNTVFNNVLINQENFADLNSAGALTIDGSSLSGFVCDHNIFSNAFSFDGQASIVAISAWQNATAQDAHSTITTSLTPMFTDPTDNDYHSLSTAPQVDEGVSSFNSKSAPTVDLDGTPRPFNSLPDAGCYEYNPNLPTVVSHTPASDATGVVQTVMVTFNKAVTAASVSLVVKDSNSVPVAGAVTPSSGTATTFTFTPSAPFAVSSALRAFVSGATDVGGDGMAGTIAWSFSTAAAPNLGPFSVFAASYVPVTQSYFDAGGTTLGMRFKADVSGVVTGVRFYKGAGNTGTHTGTLWSNSGTSLASVTFSGESSSGWQTATFSSPVSIVAGTVYVIGYYAPAGHYAVDSGLLAAMAYDAPPLHAPADNPSADRNGVTNYGVGFPTSVGTSGVPVGSSYGVDVIFDGRFPGPGSTGIATNAVLSMTYNVAIANTPTFTLKDHLGNSVAGTLSYNSSTHTFTFTPTSALSGSETYTASISGAQDAAGNVQVGTTSWSFTSAAAATPHRLFSDASVPGTVDSGDGSDLTLGVLFKSDVDATITKVKFYKSTANTGTHVGKVWDLSGTLLGSITFSGETASGWQSATLGTPINITAGTRYWVSVHMPAGHYSDDVNYFASGYDAAPLHVNQGGSSFGSGFATGDAWPDANHSNVNYWIDVETLS